MEGFHTAILDTGDVSAVLPAVAMLLVFTLVFALIAVARFRLSDTKTMN